MKRALAVSLQGLLLVAMLAPALALADRAGRNERRRSIPEFDPAAAGAIAALVAGGGVLLARRRR